jgi:hypothetical protein
MLSKELTFHSGSTGTAIRMAYIHTLVQGPDFLCTLLILCSTDMHHLLTVSIRCHN